MIAFLFPGQGSQYPACLHKLGGATPHECITETIQEACDVLGMDVRLLDQPEALRSTVAVQLVLFISGVATYRALRAEGIEPGAVAGLSVGAYGAAVACESIAFADALRLLHLRAKLMETAYPSGYGMLAISGLNEREVGALLSAKPGRCAYLANVNAPRQIVVSGADADLHDLYAAALKSGARKAERLAVSVPSHSILLDDAAHALDEAATSIPFADPTILYVGNRGARPLRQAEAIRAELTNNLRYPVRWHDSTIVLSESGVEVFVEMAPGQTLSRLVEDALPGTFNLAVDQSNIPAVASLLKAQRKHIE